MKVEKTQRKQASNDTNNTYFISIATKLICDRLVNVNRTKTKDKKI